MPHRTLLQQLQEPGVDAQLLRADALLEATALPQLRVRRPHLAHWARKPQLTPPPAHTGNQLWEAAALRVLHATRRGEEPPAHAFGLLIGFLHPDIHLHDTWHPERTFYANLTSPWTRDAMAQLLRALPEPLRERCLLAADPIPWPWLCTAPTDAVLQRALDEVADWRQRPDYDEEEVAQGLIACGDAARPHLIAHLTAQRPPPLRRYAAQALAALNTPDAAPAWLHLLGDTRADLRSLASDALAQLGAEVAVPLLHPLLHHKRKPLRLAAAQALAALPSDHPAVLRAAADALEKGEDDPATRDLLEQRAAPAEHPGLTAWRLLRATPPSTRATRYLSVYQNPVQADPNDPAFLAGAALELIAEPLNGHLHLWEQTLHIFHDHPAAPWAAVEVLATFTPKTSYIDQHINQLLKRFGDDLLPPILELLQRQGHSLRALLLGVLVERRADALPLFLDALQDGTPAERDAAMRGLVAAGPDALSSLLPLLTSRKKATREAAAVVLRRVPHPDALPALDAALAKERSDTTRDLLQRARDAAAGRAAPPLPPLRRPWDTAQPDDPNDLLALLRDLLHDPLDPTGWALLWSLIDRLAALGLAALAFDYLRPTLRLARPHLFDQAPWHWRDDPALLIFKNGEPVEEGAWITADALLRGRAQPWLDAVLPHVEHNTRARPLPPEHLHTFTRALRDAWALCAQHGIDPARLELRVDGGTARRGTTAPPRTTALLLLDGYRGEVQRTIAEIEGDGLPPGLRVARVPLPADHPARDTFNLGDRDTHLDLRPWLA